MDANKIIEISRDILNKNDLLREFCRVNGIKFKNTKNYKKRISDEISKNYFSIELQDTEGNYVVDIFALSEIECCCSVYGAKKVYSSVDLIKWMGHGCFLLYNCKYVDCINFYTGVNIDGFIRHKLREKQKNYYNAMIALLTLSKKYPALVDVSKLIRGIY